MRLREIPAQVYAREVLPRTAELWAGRRPLDSYIAKTLEFAASPYGRRHYRTLGLYDGTVLVASFKRYDSVLRDGARRLRAFGFGAVFTPAEYRGRGYASVMLASALDAARAGGYDVAYLFSDIRPQFYSVLGFRMLPSRKFSLRADALPSGRLAPVRLESDDDWRGVRRCYEFCLRRGGAGFARGATLWGWTRSRTTQRSEYAAGDPVNLALRRGNAVQAYVLGTRLTQRDAYVVDEYGFGNAAAAEKIPALLQAAAGDLRRITGWLPPAGWRDVLPKLAVRRRNAALLMVTPLRPHGAQFVDRIAAANLELGWATDHI
jgi:GNAT superfamily N-acetyltransferase